MFEIQIIRYTNLRVRFKRLFKEITDADKRMAEIAVVRTQIVNCLRTRVTYATCRTPQEQDEIRELFTARAIIERSFGNARSVRHARSQTGSSGSCSKKRFRRNRAAAPEARPRGLGIFPNKQKIQDSAAGESGFLQSGSRFALLATTATATFDR